MEAGSKSNQAGVQEELRDQRMIKEIDCFPLESRFFLIHYKPELLRQTSIDHILSHAAVNQTQHLIS